jgi:glycine cleavage system H protein
MTHVHDQTDAVTVGVRGYRVRVDRAYDPQTHMWVQAIGTAAVRVGLDPLGVEINGTLAQLSLVARGEGVERRGPFGQLEAAKFVGPLLSPVAGVVSAVNADVLIDPGVVEREPYGAGWLVELDVGRSWQHPDLIVGRDAVIAWFARKVEEYRVQGVLAE